MAQFLIRKTDSNAVKDFKMRRGDIIQSYPNGTITEKVSNPNAYLLEIPDMSFEDSKVYMQSTDKLKRTHYLDIDALAIGDKTDLETDTLVKNTADITFEVYEEPSELEK